MTRRIPLLAAAVSLVWGLHANAQTIYVPADYGTITEAIAAASNGTTIEVSAGTYMEEVDLDGKALVLLGVDGSAATTIVTPGTGISAAVAGDVEIGGFTIQAGDVGLAAVADTLILDDLVFDGMGLPTSAYALDISGTSSLAATDVVVRGYTSAVHPVGILDLCDGVTFTRGVFENNTTTAGAHLSVSASDGVFSECSFANLQGGTAAMEVVDVSGPRHLTLDGCSFDSNGTTGLVAIDSQLTVENGEFLSNQGTDGGGMSIDASTVVVDRVRFIQNVASGDGGAVYALDSDLEIGWSHLLENQALNGGGLAVDQAAGTLDLVDTRVADNVAGVIAGGVYAVGGTLTATGDLFSRNVAAADGGGLYLDGVGADLVNVTLALNEAPSGSGITTTSGVVVLNNAIIANGVGAYGIDGHVGVTVTYSDVYGHTVANYNGMSDPTNTWGNISDDPLFVDALNDDYHLQSVANGDPQTSPCVDTGDPDPTLDDADGSRSDMGAYGGPTPLAQDEDGDGWSVEDGDCDDTDASSYPGGIEVCDAADNNCDGTVDEGFDGDGDGVTVCGADGISGTADDDCDDADADNFPGNVEACDGFDNDCDGALLPQEATDADGDGFPECNDCDDTDEDLNYADADGDGASSCDGDCDDEDNRLNLLDWDGDGYTTCDDDCDDSDPWLNPEDNDFDGDSTCDGDCDDTDSTLNALDQDNDGYSTCDGDCNDGQSVSYPGAPENCDGYDNDCDGEPGEDEVDEDSDGFMICEDDCDDSDPTIYVGAEEQCDGKDNDCDGFLSPEETDDDGDGFTECMSPKDCDDTDPAVFPDAVEICNGIDDDCDDLVDEEPECYQPEYTVDGGGGCHVGGRADPGGPRGLALLLGLALLGALRGRRFRRHLPVLVLAVAGAIPTVTPAPAAAQDGPAGTVRPSIELHPVRTNADALGLLSVEGAEVLQLLKPSFGLHLNLAKDPLLLHIDDEPLYPQDRYDFSLVRTMVTMDLQGAVGFGVADVAVALPIHFARLGEGAFDWEELTGGGIGDLRLAPKVTVFNPGRRKYGLAVALPITMPLAYASSGVGDPSVRVEPTVIGELRLGPLQTMLNIGPRLRSQEMAMNEIDLAVQHEFLFRFGVGLSPVEALQFVGEIQAAAGGEGTGTDPAEFLAGARIFPGHGLRIEIAGGRGLNNGYGAPDFRLIAGVTFAREQLYSALPQKDRDGDGIADAVDRCVREPEDMDGWEDTDGCPEKDNDGDGILDAEDKCPNEPENYNANQDDDGCPDDDPDTDADGLSDRDDPCPRDPETINGIEDYDGCPDRSLAMVSGDWTRIAVERPIVFASGRESAEKDSVPVVDAVASILTAYPEIASLEVQAHTDDIGSERANEKLSQKRAEWIVSYLAGKGIDEGRLVAKGYGESVPIIPAKTDEARAINRRVEFHILSMSETPQPVTGKAPEVAGTEAPAGGEDQTQVRELTPEELEQQRKALEEAAKARKAAGEEDVVKAVWGEEGDETGSDVDTGDEAGAGDEGTTGDEAESGDEAGSGDEAAANQVRETAKPKRGAKDKAKGKKGKRAKKAKKAQTTDEAAGDETAEEEATDETAEEEATDEATEEESTDEATEDEEDDYDPWAE